MDIEARRTFVSVMEQVHGRQLRRFLAARMRNDAADIPDLVQEVYLRLLRVKNHESIRNPQAYLYTVAAHVLHQHVLRRATMPLLMDGPLVDGLDIGSDLSASLANDPAAEVELQQRFENLGRSLQETAPRAYIALLMYRCDGATLEQIGARFGVTSVMARKYLLKAITYCHRCLEEQQE